MFDDDLTRVESGRSVILQGLEEFREHLGGILTLTLVPEIGRKIEVNDMDESEVLKSIDELLFEVKAHKS